jgi:hypothetical protein
MANVTSLAKGGTANSPATNRAPNIVTHEVNIASAVAAGLATTEYVVVTNIPADTYFRLLQVEVVTSLSLGAGARIDLGDSADDDEFVSNATTLTAGTNLTLLKGDGSSGDVYTAADTLRLKVTGGTLASGILRFVWLQGDTARNALAVSS